MGRALTPQHLPGPRDTLSTVFLGPLTAAGRWRGQVGKLSLGKLSEGCEQGSGVRPIWFDSRAHQVVTICL